MYTYKKYALKFMSASIVASLFFSITSCKDIIEPNIKNQTVTILSPTNNFNSQSTNVTFWWDNVMDATNYRLQIVNPSFSNIQKFIMDTTLKTNKFTYTLPSGTYQWRIRAENSYSFTDFFLRTFTIDSTLNLSNQIVNLVSPTNNFITNKYTNLFKWNKITAADDYRFEISSGGSGIFANATYKYDTISYTFSNDGIYDWKVKAQNAQSASIFTTRTITIDATAPAVVSLSSPLDLDSTTFKTGTKNKAAINLSWTRPTDSGTTITDSIIVYQQSGLIISNKILAATTTNTFNSTTTSDSLAVGKYYWKIRSYDAAGNKSNYSTVRTFKVMP